MYGAFVVMFAIVVVCTSWWDWVKNVGALVETNAREFAIDMAILVDLMVVILLQEPIAVVEVVVPVLLVGIMILVIHQLMVVLVEVVERSQDLLDPIQHFPLCLLPGLVK